MTAIASWIDRGGKVWIGGDSGASDESGIYVRKDVKVFKIGPFLIGGSGSYRGIQLLQHGGHDPNAKLSKLRPPKIKLKMQEFMVTKFVPIIRSIFSQNGFISFNDGAEMFDGSFIVGIDGMLFVIEGDFQVGNYEKYISIGSGSEICMGSLYSSEIEDLLTDKEDKGGEEVINVALNAASEFSQSVKGPFTILSV